MTPKLEIVPPANLTPSQSEPDVRTEMVVKQGIENDRIAAIVRDLGLVQLDSKKLRNIEELGVYLTGVSALHTSAGRVFMDASIARGLIKELSEIVGGDNPDPMPKIMAAGAAAPLLRAILESEKIISHTVTAIKELKTSAGMTRNKSAAPGATVAIQINNPPGATATVEKKV